MPQKIKTLKSMLVMLFVGTAMLSFGQAKSSFPYQLTKADVPAGFIVPGPFSKDEKEMSLSANPGIVTNKKLIETLYNNINTNAISRVFVASYVPNKHAEDGLEVYILECRSKALLNQEQAKLTREKGCRYLEKDKYLFIIWSSGSTYYKQIDALADKLKNRWQLTDISNHK